MGFLEGFLGIFILVVFLSGCEFLGEHILQLLSRGEPSDADGSLFSFSAAIGIALLSTVMLSLSLFGLLSTPILTPLAMILGIAGLVRLRLLATSKRDARIRQALRYFTVPAAAITILSLPILIAPPFFRDSLVYHLELPRQYLLHNGMVEISSNVYTYFPAGIEMLYTFGQALFPSYSARFIHFGFLILTMLGVVEYAGLATSCRKLPQMLLTALMAFALIPTLWLESTSAYIDAGWMFFSFVILAGLDYYFRCNKRHLLGTASIAAGFLFAIKYTSVYFILTLCLAALLIRLLLKVSVPVSWKSALIFKATFLLSAAPYYIRNFILTGDPMFPFLSTILTIHTPYWSSVQQDAFWGFLNRYGSTTGDILLHPFSFLLAALNIHLDNPELFDGVLGPFLLLCLLALVGNRQFRKQNMFILLTTICYAITWGVSIRQARFLLPVLPGILLIVIFVAIWIYDDRKKIWSRLLAIILAGILALNLVILIQEWRRVPYLSHFFGQINQQEFLAETLPVFKSQQFINDNLPQWAVIWVLLTGNENFYLERPYIADYVVEDYRFHNWLKSASNPDEVAEFFHRFGVTHILIRRDVIFSPDLYTDMPEKLPLVIHFLNSRTRLLFEANGFAVHQMNQEPKHVSRVVGQTYFRSDL